MGYVCARPITCLLGISANYWEKVSQNQLVITFRFFSFNNDVELFVVFFSPYYVYVSYTGIPHCSPVPK